MEQKLTRFFDQQKRKPTRLFKLRKAVLSGMRPSGDFPLRSLGHFEGARGAKQPLMGYSFSASPA